MDSVSLRKRLNNYVKSVPHAKWIRRCITVLILLAFGYGYYTEQQARIQAEENIRKLVIVHNIEINEYNTLVTDLTRRQITQHTEMLSMRAAIMMFQRTIYEMYKKLREYDKTLPPWGGEYEPVDPDDKYIKQ